MKINLPGGPKINSILFCVTLAFFGFLVFYKLDSTTLVDWDEAIYGSVTKDMVTLGHWLYPSWGGEPYLIKPPLYMWLSAPLFRILGNQEFPMRFWSGFSGLLGLIFTYLLSRKLFNRYTASIACLILATTFHYIYYSRITSIDSTVSALALGSLWFFWLARERPKFILISALFLGMAVLTKSVVGLLGLPAMILLYLIDINYRKIGGRIILLSLLIFSLVVLPWHFLMYLRFGSKFIDTYLLYNVLARATTAQSGTTTVFWDSIAIIRNSLRIWFPLLPLAALGALWRVSIKKDRGLVFIGAYALTVFFVFSLSKNTLVWYLVPLYPPLAILLGRFLERLFDLVSRQFRVNYKIILLPTTIGLMLISFSYVLSEKDRIFTPDYNGDFVNLIKIKERMDPGNEQTLFINGIGGPVAYYYNHGKYEIYESNDYLDRKIPSAGYVLTDKTVIDKYGQEFVTLAKSGQKVLVIKAGSTSSN